ncbi:MAG: dihydrodipicolinate synthase family protein [Chloroflexi bacterium]|nr:dihydrodipicolinate synthase family protein [Chloroflexota bacterium]MDA1271752.1 dihydrodipicolinate synthase family protein [Chloroflexota bacterium]
MVERFSGVHWMLATPFHEDEGMDKASMANLVDKAVSSGCQGMVCLGVTGEVARLTDRERHEVAEVVITRAEGYPVTVGATAASTAAAIQYSKDAQELGAAAVMVSPPPMGKPNPDAVFAHYARLADAIDVPIVVQDYPSTSGVHMSPEFVARLSNGIPAAQYLKLEDPPTPPKISAIRKLVGDDMPIFGGLGGVFLLEELARGSAGAMTGFAYPEVLVDICRQMAEGDRTKAEELFNRCLPLMLFEFQEGIGVAIRKYALHSRGFIENPKVRAPGPGVTDETKAEFHRLVGAVGLSDL